MYKSRIVVQFESLVLIPTLNGKNASIPSSKFLFLPSSRLRRLHPVVVEFNHSRFQRIGGAAIDDESDRALDGRWCAPRSFAGSLLANAWK